MSDLIRSGYWPASVNADTMSSVHLKKSFYQNHCTQFIKTRFFADVGEEDLSLWKGKISVDQSCLK